VGDSSEDSDDPQGDLPSIEARLRAARTRSSGTADYVVRDLLFEAEAVVELLRRDVARSAHHAHARAAALNSASSHRARIRGLLRALSDLCVPLDTDSAASANTVSDRGPTGSAPLLLPDASNGRPPHLACFLLGPHRTYVPGRELKEWRGRRAQTLFHYLVSCGARRVSWEVLVEALWPGMRETAGRRRLHQAVYALRQTLHALDPDTAHIVCSTGTYRINPDLTTWVDTVEFDRLVSRARRSDGTTDDGEALAAYDSADALYRGDFLADEPAIDWAVAERDRLRTSYIATAVRFAELLEENGDHQRVVTVCQRARTYEPWNEELTRLEMRALVALGHRTQALASYRSCAASLSTELDTPPDAATTGLYRAIADDHLPRPDPGGTRITTKTTGTATPSHRNSTARQ
jgi:DNA-binding SARP family transcriptional activator